MTRRRAAFAALGILAGVIVLAAMVIVVLATTPWGNERVRRYVVSAGNGRITGDLSVGTLRGNLFSGATLSNVQVLDSLQHPVFAARGVQVKYALLPALRGRLVIRSLVLDTPVVVMDKRPGGKWNFQSLLKPSTTPKDTTTSSPPPELSNIIIRHGRFLYRRPWRPDSSLATSEREVVIAKALDTSARKRTARVPGGYQRILDYRNIDARLPTVRIGSRGAATAVDIAALSMLAEPYRPPAIDIKSLVGTLYASKDSLWWRGARMVLPASTVSGDGTIGFHRSGFRLDLTGAPVALADLRWLDPKLANGGGTLRYTMNLHGDTADFAVSDADVRYGDASLIGHASVSRISPAGGKSELLVNGADVTIANLTTAAIHELAPSITLRRTGTLGGHVVMSGASSAMQLSADVQFADAAAGRSSLVVKGGVGFGGGVSARDLSVQLLPLQLATLKGSGVNVPVGGVVSGTALVNGTQRDGWTVRGDLTHVERGEPSHISGVGRYQVAGKRIVADATLHPLSLATVGRFAPSAQLRGNVSGDIHAEGTARDLRLSGVIHSATGGTFDGRGAVSIAGKRVSYDVTAALDALDARAFSARAPETRLTGTVMARGTGTSPATANAVFSADLVRSRYDTFTIERLLARGATTNGLLRLDTLDAAESGARVVARGTLGLTRAQAGQLGFSANVESLSSLRRWLGGTDSGVVAASPGRQAARLAVARADSARRARAVRIEQLALGLPTGVALVMDSLPGIRRDSLAGSLVATGQFTGNLKELGVDATVRGAGLVVRGNSVRRLSGTVRSTNVRNRATDIAFHADADTLQLAGYGFERLNTSGLWKDGRVTADVQLRQDSLVSYAARGSYAHPATGEHDVQLDSLRAVFDTLVWRLAHPGRLRLADGAIMVDSIDVKSSGAGRLFANGVVPKNGAISLDVAAENVRVATVLRAMQRDSIADGTLAAQARIQGTRASPTLTGRVALRNASYGGTRAPDVNANADYSSQRLVLAADAFDSTGQRVVSGTGVLPIDLALAGVTGSRLIEGPLVADVVLDSLQVEGLPIRPRILDELRGTLFADAHVRGTWKSPLYTGLGSLRDGALRMSLATTGMRVDSMVADVRLSRDSLILDSLTARAGKGPFRASGSIDLRDMKRPFVRLSAKGTDLRVFDSPRGLVDANGELVAVGPLDELRVTGTGEMLGGYLALKQFRKDLLRVKAPGDLSFLAVFDTSAAASDSIRVRTLRARPRRMAIIAELTLVIDRGNYYRNRPDANTEFYTGEGEVVRAFVDQRSNDAWAVGFVNVGDAGLTLFRTRAFVPARGTLTLTPHTDAPGIVQQVGERIVWEPGRGLLPLNLFTGGTTKAPSIGLESGALFPIRGRELNSYLTMGRLATSLLQQSGSSLSGSSGWSGQLGGETGALAHRQQGATALGVVLHDIGTGATKEYGLDAFSVSPADVPTELVFGKTGGVRGALVEGGRYLTAERYLAGSIRLFTASFPGVRLSQKFGTTYRLDVGIEPRFLFRGVEELGISHPTVRTGAFGAFLTRMWDF